MAEVGFKQTQAAWHQSPYSSQLPYTVSVSWNASLQECLLDRQQLSWGFLNSPSASKSIRPAVQSKYYIRKSPKWEGSHLRCMMPSSARVLILSAGSRSLPLTCSATAGATGSFPHNKSYQKHLSPLGQQRYGCKFSNGNVMRQLKENRTTIKIPYP